MQMERTVETPLGLVTLIGLRWGHAWREDASPLLERAAAQLAAYFASERRSFDLPTSPEGTSTTAGSGRQCATFRRARRGPTAKSP